MSKAPVVGSHDRLDGGGGLLQVVVRDLGQQVVHHVRADVVVDLVEDTVVAVQRRQTAAQVAPLLRVCCLMLGIHYAGTMSVHRLRHNQHCARVVTSH